MEHLIQQHQQQFTLLKKKTMVNNCVTCSIYSLLGSHQLTEKIQKMDSEKFWFSRLVNLELDNWLLACSRPSRDRAIVTHLLGRPGLLRAFSSSSRAPFFFFNFLTSESTAFSAHFSSSSPCFQPRRRLTAGLVNENRLLRLLIDEDIADTP